jgi:hypothetical protein
MPFINAAIQLPLGPEKGTPFRLRDHRLPWEATEMVPGANPGKSVGEFAASRTGQWRAVMCEPLRPYQAVQNKSA